MSGTYKNSKSIFPSVLLLFLTLNFSSCVSRLERPALSGFIVDENKKPIAGCKVGETVTAADGSFHLKEIRYRKFFIPEMFMLEAPPVMVSETIEKPGYQKSELKLFQTFGGGQKKGAKLDMGTIVLKFEKDKK
ncbi:hypothetical protein [Pedobacter paludis]|uniref:Carboxypeptidase regulatory-like domain-containing protein n=1 Tax=Pedobacter paludis TaxID=2203212 RepID=A0A317EWR7_9SPHI|nr:hypothetical protein [Pedobacter paludis]PWS29666.1 hypothetical protein DF947_21710 [Pedobacter paludis]